MKKLSKTARARHIKRVYSMAQNILWDLCDDMEDVSRSEPVEFSTDVWDSHEARIEQSHNRVILDYNGAKKLHAELTRFLAANEPKPKPKPKPGFSRRPAKRTVKAKVKK